jgi:hypothetical protein
LSLIYWNEEKHGEKSFFFFLLNYLINKSYDRLSKKKIKKSQLDFCEKGTSGLKRGYWIIGVKLQKIKLKAK